MTANLKSSDKSANPANPSDAPAGGAAAIFRGTRRMLFAARWVSLAEMALPDGHRADIMAINDRGEIVIVEVKSSLADFRSDNKWQSYRDFCDRFYFAVDAQFPDEVLPEDTGLIRADAYNAVILREAEPVKLAAARRKALINRFGVIAAQRLLINDDPWCADLQMGAG